MKKRSLFTLMLVALLAFSLGMGTLAYYTKTFESNGNIVRAAKFTVDSGGTLDKSVEFDLTGDPLIPGKSKDLYEFKINKTGTEVPVRYEITATGKDELFYSGTPVKLNVYRKIGENDWQKIKKNKIVPEKDIEEFKVEAVWKHSNNDIHYQGKKGKVNIKVVATQMDGELDPFEPEDEDLEIAVNAEYEFRVNDGGYMTINVEDLDGATVEFRYEMEGNPLFTSGIISAGVATHFLHHDEMPENIRVLVYDKYEILATPTPINVRPINITKY